MTSRSREERRSSGRLPGIWRGPLTADEPIQAPEQAHGGTGRVFVSWRIFSALIVVALMTVMFVFFGSDYFYVHSVGVGGLHYLTKEEVFSLSGIANMHIFWVDPAAVRTALLRSPTIADATVNVTWPPNMVQIVIQEREPALVWEQAGVATWIDLQGRVMRQREDRPDLLRVSADGADLGPLGPQDSVDEDAVSGALQLRTLFPDISVLRYNAEKGLGYVDQKGWDAWFGVGTDMPERILIYNAIVADLQSRGIQPSEVNVENPDAPFYCSKISGCPGGQ
jgi:cell division septal protein FtsQ